MNALLVNADDFGLHESVNAAIASCVEFGSVNSVSVIVNGAAPDFELLKHLAQKNIFIGIHIAWVGEPWITGAITIYDWKELIQKIFTGGKSFRMKLKEEADAQIRRMINNNIIPDHIDSHQHIHHFPLLWEITTELQKKHCINKIRIANVKSKHLLRNNISGLALNMLASQKQNNEPKFYCAGIKYAGNYNIDLFDKELKLSSGLDTELIVHPGTSNAQLNKFYSHWQFNWENEFQSLNSKDFINSVSENNFYFLRKK
jgi:predicted glycoside hydrolase/deacetylase ChbG (UPF0249 family)